MGSSAPEDPPKIEDYLIDRTLGTGGGGTVYRALQTRTGHPVALKLLHVRPGSGPAAQRAWRELQVLEQLRLPAVPRLLDYGVYQGRMYLVTEFLDALPIDRFCESPLAPPPGRASPPPPLGEVPRLGEAERAPFSTSSSPPRTTPSAPLSAQAPGLSSPGRGANEGQEEGVALSQPPPKGEGAELPSSRPPWRADLLSAALPSCRPAALPLPSRVTLLIRAARAVQSLHEHGVIHRDIKPSNILIDAHQQAFIIDLGLASLLDADPTVHQQTLTTDGSPIGSPAFMAPEQARGERTRTSTRTDVFCLGATALYVLTGHTPFDTHGSLHQLLRRVADEMPRKPRDLDASLPKPLAAVLTKATSRDPLDRYASAGAFADDLERWSKGQPVEAGSPGIWMRSIRWVGRNPIKSTAVVCVGMVAMSVLLTFASVWYLSRYPSHVIQDPGERSARLVSRAGNTLHEWRGDRGDDVFGRDFDRPSELGGGRVVVTRVGNSVPPDPNDGQLCLWDIDRLDRPFWVSSSGEPDLTQPVHYRELGKHFNVQTILVADIFPSEPGLEVVATHANIYSLRCIRVYNLRGETLYSAWHDGGITNLYWMPGPGLLICSGDNQENSWLQLGHPEVTKLHNPQVIFAIRPALHADLKMLHGPERDPDPRARLEWCLCVLPPWSNNILQPYLGPPRGPAQAKDHVGALLKRADGKDGLSWLLDERGVVVPGSLIRGDGGLADWDSLRLGEVYLGDLPGPFVGPTLPDAPAAPNPIP